MPWGRIPASVLSFCLVRPLLLACLPGVFAVLPGCATAVAPAQRGEMGASEADTDHNAGEKRLQFKLNNGLEVILEENHAAPVVALQAWVKVGAGDEPVKLAGISHFLEHMLFKGTARRGVGQIAREIESAGGEINAWTSFDETVFHLVVAGTFIDNGIDVLADALSASSFDATELERERLVILEEIKQGLDDPDRIAAQAMFSGAFGSHPYGRPVIGSVETVTKMGRNDLVAFHRSRYHAGNITLVVVGDFDTKKTRATIESAFGVLPKGDTTRKRPEPPAPASSLKVLSRDVKESQIMFAFRVPAVRHEDVPVLDLLSVVLGHGDSSRLHKEIVRNRQLAKSAFSYVFTTRQAGVLVAGASVGAGKMDTVARAVLADTLAMAHTEISADEMDRARTILESERVFDRETVQGYARKLGYFAAIAEDLDFETRYMARLAAVKPADLRQIAERYLRIENVVTVAQVPTARKGGSDEDAKNVSRLTAKLSEVVAESGKRAVARSRKVVASRPEDNVVRHVFPNGMRVLMLRDRSVPIVAMRAMWVGGLRLEDTRNNGVSNLIATLLNRGTKSRTAEQISAEVDGLAGSLSGYAGRNSIGVQAEFLSRHWEKGVEIVADCLLNSVFDDDELEKEKRIIVDDIRAQDDSPGHAAFRLFHQTLWHRHPYRMDLSGTVDSVSGFTRRRLLTHYRQHYSPANLTLAIVGDVDPASMLSTLAQLFEAETKTAAPPPLAPVPEPAVVAPRQAFSFLEREQAHLVLGFPGVSLDHPDRFAIEVLSQVLSGQGGRLFSELREKRGLVYRVSAFSLEGIDPGYLAVYLACSPDKLTEALDATRAQINSVVQNGITAEELDRARRYLIGVNAIGLQRKSAIAAALAFHEAYGQGWQAYRAFPKQIGAVTRADVTRVARKFLDLNREILVSVKPREATPAAAAQGAAARN